MKLQASTNSVLRPSPRSEKDAHFPVTAARQSAAARFAGQLVPEPIIVFQFIQ